MPASTLTLTDDCIAVSSLPTAEHPRPRILSIRLSKLDTLDTLACPRLLYVGRDFVTADPSVVERVRNALQNSLIPELNAYNRLLLDSAIGNQASGLPFIPRPPRVI